MLARKIIIVSVLLTCILTMTGCAKSSSAYDRDYEESLARNIIAHNSALSFSRESVSAETVYSADSFNLVETDEYEFKPSLDYLISDDENHYIAVVECKYVPKNSGWSTYTKYFRVSFVEKNKSVSNVEVFDYAPMYI